jgi:hypothetical protein
VLSNVCCHTKISGGGLHIRGEELIASISVLNERDLMQRRLDFVLQVKDNDQPCKQKTMIEKELKDPNSL